MWPSSLSTCCRMPHLLSASNFGLNQGPGNWMSYHNFFKMAVHTSWSMQLEICPTRTLLRNIEKIEKHRVRSTKDYSFAISQTSSIWNTETGNVSTTFKCHIRSMLEFQESIPGVWVFKEHAWEFQCSSYHLAMTGSLFSSNTWLLQL